MADLIPVFVADADATKFLVFQQYYEPFTLLLNAGVFEQRKATVLLDIDAEGKIKSIRRQDYLYTER